MTVTFINLCRKRITLLSQEGEPIVLEPATQPAYVKSSRVRDMIEIYHNGGSRSVEIIYSTTHGVINVPPPQDQTFYIVPSAVANALPERTDLLVTGGLDRDERGHIRSANSVIQTTTRGMQSGRLSA